MLLTAHFILLPPIRWNKYLHEIRSYNRKCNSKGLSGQKFGLEKFSSNKHIEHHCAKDQIAKHLYIFCFQDKSDDNDNC